jgi:hypothetical protein
MEKMFSFLKSTTTHGSQPVVGCEGGMLDVAKVITSHDGNMPMVSNMQIIGQYLLSYVSHFVGLGCYVSSLLD